MRSAEPNLRVAELLDRRFALLRGEKDKAKQTTLVEVTRVLDSAGVPYALIDGVAVQIWSSEPRTTLDIDVAVPSYDRLPLAALASAGFTKEGRFEHSENWRGPDGTPVQFTDDPLLAEAIRAAVPHAIADRVLRVAPVLELVRSKLRAADDPARRRSRRLIDLADACALTEQHPAALAKLAPDERRRLES